jgi:Lrp/AsnC family transcriptional regulator for asnA, asnC and gidA
LVIVEKGLDPLDKRLITTLAKDGRVSHGKISELLGVTSPTVRTRIDRLIQSGILRVIGVIDTFKTKGIALAIVGITLERHQELDEKLEQISNLDRINWAAVVTGRYDIIVEVVLSDDMDDLYGFLTKDLPSLGGIRSTESFVVMKAKRKWIYLPRKYATWQ